MSKKVTLSDIAEALGVSIYTVSQALAGKPGVSRTTRKKVLDTAKALGYQMKASQKSEQRPPQKTDSAPYILVWSHAQLLEESMYWQRVLKGIGFGCKQYGWQYVIVPLETENPPVIPAYLDAESCVGGIAAGTVQSEFLVAVKQQNMPLVLVDHEERMLDADSVVNGNQEAAVSAAQRLIANGRKRLLFVGHDAFSVSFRERWLGLSLCRGSKGSALHI